MRRSAILAAALAAATLATAAVHSPRVVSPHNADAYSLKTFADFHRWRDLEGDARAWEIYKYLADTRTGLFGMYEVTEGDDVLSEYRTVFDPIKIMNVYGYGYCYILGPVMAAICEGASVGRARIVSFPDWHHVAAETFYDGDWHYLDLDLRAAFRRPDGSLASLAGAREDASLWTGRGPLFFPMDVLDTVSSTFRTTPFEYYYRFAPTGYTMDYVLNQGERFTRWWRPQGGRWHHLHSYNQPDWIRQLIEGDPRGPAPKHRSYSVYNYGNGRFVYEPDLSSNSSDFSDGAIDAENVELAEGGVTLTDPGEGYAVFAVESPYIIVPIVGDLDTSDDDRGASVVEIDAESAALSLSLDNGLTWQELDVDSYPAAVDLTSRVAGTYGYLLKVLLEGRPGEALLRSVRITTWVQVASASLPALGEGSNRMEYRVGDHHGMRTRRIAICPNVGAREQLLKHLVEPPADYDPGRKTGRVRGEMIARVPAPSGTRIAWFSAGANFRTHIGQAASQTQNSIAYAVGEPEGFTEIYNADVPTYCRHWNYNADTEAVLEEPAEVVYVRYVGEPAVNDVRVYAHCVPVQARPESPVTVTHTWREGSERHTKQVELSGPGAYEIVAGGDPVNESIEISVPSDGAVAEGGEGPPERDAAQPGPHPAEAHWVGPMKAVHARFTGQRGVFAQFGDSISHSRAFWTSLRWQHENAPDEMMRDFQTVSEYMLEECWDWKGPEYGNQGGMTIRWADGNVDTWLEKLNPETVLIMFGTNDLNSLGLAEYTETTRRVVQECLDNGTVVILSTIPPRHSFEQKAGQFAEAFRGIAHDMNLPLVEFHKEILGRRPDDWDGAMEKFAEYEGYDVPTLIARDGVHPSNPKQYFGRYSDEALNHNGFSLWNYLVLGKYAAVIREVLEE